MTPETDGRLRRSAATRERIVSAMADLIREGVVAPTTDLIASRAGVSSRSLFFRFRDTPELFLAVIDQVMTDLVPRLPPVPSHRIGSSSSSEAPRCPDATVGTRSAG